jgi:hypothetical protein
MKIRVTKTDCRKGVRGCPYDCAAARAIWRVSKCRVKVKRDYITCLENDKRVKTPRPVRRFMDDYDTRPKWTAEPVEFELPDELFAGAT